MTGDAMVRRALALITVLGEGETPTGEMAENARIALNAMLADWSNLGLSRYQFDVLTTELNLTDGWDRAIPSNLAVEIAPEYGREAPASVMRTATMTLRRLRRKEVGSVPLSLETERFLSINNDSMYDIITNEFDGSSSVPSSPSVLDLDGGVVSLS